MKQLLSSLYIFITASVILGMVACTKDKGNYSYDIPADPLIANLDSVYYVFVGDSLKIDPVVTANYKATYVLNWKIGGPNVKDFLFQGAKLHAIFGLGAGTYYGELVVTNSDNEMKYFRTFKVVSQTAFAKGTIVLSSLNGVTQLSFIKPDGTVQPNTYGAVNPNEKLPEEPTQLLAAPQAYQPPIKSYWVFGKKGASRGTQIDANSFVKIKTLEENFFDPLEVAINPYRMFVNPLSVISGVINGKLYYGATQTWDQAPTYGMFNSGATGDYELSPEIVCDYTGTFGPGYYVAFDTKHKQFVRFNLYNGPQFFGPAYSVIGTAFDPTNIDLQLVHLERINGGLCYAYFRENETSTVLYEYKFQAVFNGPFEFRPLAKTVFAKPELINANTKWASTPSEIIYIAQGDKIYRYNPVNTEFKVLTADMGGKSVTMIKVIDDGATLVAGTESNLYYLNISVGNLGTLIKKITGVPGNPVDIAIRNQ